MGKLRALILVSFLLYSPFSTTAQSIQNNTPQFGNPIELKLGPGQTHEFTIALEENNYLQFVVEQHGIDVIVRVFSPAGKAIGEYDSPNGSEGPEHVSFVAGAAGNYRIAISPLDPSSATIGRFKFTILELRPANDEELKSSKNLEVVKAKGIALLAEIEETIPQIKSPHTRISSQLWAAKLLFGVDEKRASKYLAGAVAGLREFLASVDEDSEYYRQYSAITQLRYEIVQIMAAHDPDAALDFLSSTNPINDPSGSQRDRLIQESLLELSIADRLIPKDPARALKIARRNLKSRFSSNLTGTVNQLWRQNPEMAVELASEIVTKLLNEKLLINNPDAASLAIGMVRIGSGSVRTIQNIAGTASKPPLLTDSQFRDLLQKLLSEALSYSQPSPPSYGPERDAVWAMLNVLQSLRSEVESLMTGGHAAVQRKLAILNGSNTVNINLSEFERIITSNGSVTESLAAIEKAPEEQRDQLYLQLANREVNNGDAAGARRIIESHVSSRQQRLQSLQSIEQQQIIQMMSEGKVEESVRAVGALRSSKERAVYLSQLVAQIGPGLKRAAALNLLEQARSMLGASPQAQDQEHMNALLELARAFSTYDPKRAFDIVDPLVDQFNEMSGAARALEGFAGEFYEDEELDLNNGSSVANVAIQLSRALGTLALTNFERAKGATDRIRLQEVRVRAYLYIASQTIQGKKE